MEVREQSPKSYKPNKLQDAAMKAWEWLSKFEPYKEAYTNFALAQAKGNRSKRKIKNPWGFSPLISPNIEVPAADPDWRQYFFNFIGSRYGGMDLKAAVSRVKGTKQLSRSFKHLLARIDCSYSDGRIRRGVNNIVKSFRKVRGVKVNRVHTDHIHLKYMAYVLGSLMWPKPVVIQEILDRLDNKDSESARKNCLPYLFSSLTSRNVKPPGLIITFLFEFF